MAYARVIVDVAHRNVDRCFSYRIPAGMEVVPGLWVRVPFSGRRIEGFVLEVTGESEIADHRLKPIEAVLDETPVLLSHLMILAEWMRRRYHGLWVDSLRLLLPAGLRGGKARIKTRRMAGLAEGIDPEAAIAALRRAPRQAAVLRALVSGARPVSDLSATLPGAAAAVKALQGRGMIAVWAEAVRRTPYRAIRPDRAEALALNEDQRMALEIILKALASEGPSPPFLLHGVTGSGKTEVYMQAIRQVLEAGKTAILLVPEIALTPQMVDGLRGRFPGVAAVLHSRLSQGERMDEWQRLRSGEARLAVGARSAVFAPVSDLGLIVIDEEHEGSYASDHAPRYDAREVAKFRCDHEGGVLVLGSATPSMETWHRAREGGVSLLEMPRRVAGRPLPQVSVVDMRDELVRGNRTAFSALLAGELAATVAAGRQAMLLLNRRGYAPFVSCRRCGKAIKCAACDISMTLHRPESVMRCHWCGREEPPPAVCPECGSAWIRYFGAGTQKIEEELRALIPGVGILRMDHDTTRGKDEHVTILRQFREGRAQVLIGTQMIAKGHDFPQVTLAGILAADLSLHVPDYRAEERTFQLITQMAGRAGRGYDPGMVVVQTYVPDHFAVRCGVAQDFRAFAEAEMRRRRVALYPPFAKIARVICASEDRAAAEETAGRLEIRMKEFLAGDADARRAIVQARARTAPIEWLRGEHRLMLYVKMYPGEAAERIVGAMAMWCREEHPAPTSLEVDPQNLM